MSTRRQIGQINCVIRMCMYVCMYTFKVVYELTVLVPVEDLACVFPIRVIQDQSDTLKTYTESHQKQISYLLSSKG